MPRLTLLAPLHGWCAPLEETPDTVFAQRMLGDGVAIDPIGNVLHAPCDGEIVSIPTTKHAIVVRSPEGAEILLHIGIDTVSLQGTGFDVHVSIGDTVRAGQPLITFDLDLLAHRAKSLITPMVITNGDEFSIHRRPASAMIEIGAALLELEWESADAPESSGDDSSSSNASVIVGHEHGVHARPAAIIASAAKKFAAEITVAAHGRHVDARSAVGLMSLGLHLGDMAEITATGADAQAAIDAVSNLLQHAAQSGPAHTFPSALREKTQPVPKPAARTPAPAAGSDLLHGVIASRGFAVGRAVRLDQAEIPVIEVGKGVAHENAEFERARNEVRDHLQRLAAVAEATARGVISAHLEFLDDWELVGSARRSIAAGKSAAYSWRRAVRDSTDLLRNLADDRLAERIDDLLDIESQVLHALDPEVVDESSLTVRTLPDQAIVVATDLKPSQFIALDAGKLAGICMAAGGPTSHVAILAAAAGVPVLVALGPELLKIKNSTWLMLDAEQGTLRISPTDAERTAADQSVAHSQQRRQADRMAAQQDCYTSDGTRIHVHANLGSLSDAQAALTQGAEGCGLLRTEFLFLDRATAPTEAEQVQLYQSIATVLADRPLVIRTLDNGGDKPIPYLPLPLEDNPALGLRGVRTSLWQEDLLRTQLRAILQVNPAEQCRVLLPMITDVAELDSVRRILNELMATLGRTTPVSLGAMVETPAAALLSAQIAARVDFMSIGTNDLTQYTLAMDRGHAALATRIDALHPAVLRLIAMTVSGASEHACLVAVCGGVASDPGAVPLLIGLGVRELSIVPSLIPQHKALLRTLSIGACKSLAREALTLDSAQAVRALIAQFSPTVARFEKTLQARKAAAD